MLLVKVEQFQYFARRNCARLDYISRTVNHFLVSVSEKAMILLLTDMNLREFSIHLGKHQKIPLPWYLLPPPGVKLPM